MKAVIEKTEPRRIGPNPTNGSSLMGPTVIPVVKEELRIAKKDIDAGGVRVATRVASVPVDKSVTIREERVKLERRAVDRPLDGSDDAFDEKCFEMMATSEEPVITKQAHVVEEIRVHKDSGERIEKIHDTLRHTDLQISQIPAEHRFDPARYREHFKLNYEAQRYPFDWMAPAYQFGEQLRYQTSNTEWSKAEPSARTMWEGKNPGTWDRFRDAIKHAFERTRK